jgi:hypothetical protein
MDRSGEAEPVGICTLDHIFKRIHQLSHEFISIGFSADQRIILSMSSWFLGN